MSKKIEPEQIAPLVAAALDPSDSKLRGAAQRELTEHLMDTPGTASFHALLSTMLADAYMTGWREGRAGAQQEARS